MPQRSYDLLAGYEQRFHAERTVNGVSYTLEPATLTSSDGAASVDIVRCRRADGSESYFTPKAIPKARICLHFTVGNVRSDVFTLCGTSKVSVPFLVARDGTVYEFFDSHYWAYHLGPSERYDNIAMSAVSIGIELSNYGPLTPDGGVLKNAYKSDYCTLEQADAFVKLATPFRGYAYFASYTEAQVKSAIALIRYLGVEHNIPMRFLPEAQRHDLLADLSRDGVGTSFLGVCSHVNFRADKFDLGPAFDWGALITALEAPPGVAEALTQPVPTAEHRISNLQLPQADELGHHAIDPHDKHEVHPGDTLTSIAAQHHTTAEALMSLNGIDKPAALEVGQMLTIPGDADTIVVQLGDTLSALAKRSGVPVEVLVYANELTDKNMIRVGQTLIVPR